MERLCHFEDKCAYKHQRILNSQEEYNTNVCEDVKKLKAEVENLKNTIKSLMKNWKEEESVEEIKTEIKLLTASYKYIREQIYLLEEDSDNETDSVEVKQS